MVNVGDHKDTLDKSLIISATFHPFKDEWYVVIIGNGDYLLLVYTNGLCTTIARYESVSAAISDCLHFSRAKEQV